MVMEIPTPQCVGREFVRQYYTLLNKAPLHLHRFYNHDSSFLHGGLDRPGQETRPVVGQQDIHERIMQLNFRDCHAKIRQVDSLETLGDGVVVQVSGELSNNGQPMRRFMQTFVLVPQSPKKYYVRNDIFRYQDEIFTEDDNDLDVEESVTRNSGCLDQDDNVGYHDNEIIRNGSAYPNEVVSQKYVPPPVVPQQVAPPSPPPPEVAEVDSAKSDWEDEDEPEEEEELEDESGRDLVEEAVPLAETQLVDANPAPVSQEPKTYANMVSRNTSGGLAPMQNAVSPVTPPHKTETPPAFHKEGSRDKSEPPSGGPTFGSGHPRPSRPRLNSGRGMGGPRFGEMGRDQQPSNESAARSPPEGGDYDSERRGMGGISKAFIHYPDSQQLFVGNLTHSITEEELKAHFTQFGRVLDMRINTKQTQKIGGGKVPNFGFIVFEDPEAVQKVLSSRPIYFNDHRLNVEEKKRPKDTRIVPPPPSRGGPSPRVGVGGGPRGGPRGGMRGGYTSRR